MLFKAIDHLRTKPEHVRRNIAIFVAGVISLAIFAVWISGLSARLSGEPTADPESPSPFSVIAEQGKAMFDSLSGREVFEDVRSSVSAGAGFFSDLASSTESGIIPETTPTEAQKEGTTTPTEPTTF